MYAITSAKVSTIAITSTEKRLPGELREVTSGIRTEAFELKHSEAVQLLLMVGPLQMIPLTFTAHRNSANSNSSKCKRIATIQQTARSDPTAARPIATSGDPTSSISASSGSTSSGSINCNSTKSDPTSSDRPMANRR